MQIKNVNPDLWHENSKPAHPGLTKPRAKSKQCKTQNKIRQDDVNGGFKGEAVCMG